MSDATSGPLRDAYEAIRANQLPKARGILSTYTLNQPNDPDAWWLYSYAAADAAEARKALENVLRLDPTYPGASDLLTQLNQSVRPESPQPPASFRKLSDVPAAAAPAGKPINTADDDFGDLDGFDDLDDLEEEPDDSGFSRRRVLIALGGFILIVLLVILVFVLLPRRTSAPEATAVAQVTPQATVADATTEPSLEATTVIATDDVSAVVSPQPSLEVTLASTTDTITEVPVATTDAMVATDLPIDVSATPDSAVVSDFGAFSTALAAFTLAPDGVGLEQTALGQTLRATICLQNQGELRTAIPDSIAALSMVSAQAPSETQYIGAKFVNCNDNSLIRYVVVSIEDARAFAAGTLSAAQLRSVHRNITR